MHPVVFVENEAQRVLYNWKGQWLPKYFVFDICKVGSKDVVQRRMPVYRLEWPREYINTTISWLVNCMYMLAIYGSWVPN